MSVSAAEHYETHLAAIYAWMVGDFDAACRKQVSYFDAVDLRPRGSAVAVDLGSGHGIQSVPLADRGFDVIAIDSSQVLLDELTQRSANRKIRCVCDDLLSSEEHVPAQVELVCCMGDTLTHLEKHKDVASLFKRVSARLVTDGGFCISFRDYASTELVGPKRFIPVRSDESRIHTCFLEYSSDFVVVHDIVHEKRTDDWITAVSAYQKLRLLPEDVVAMAAEWGLHLSASSVECGLHSMVLHRRPPK